MIVFCITCKGRTQHLEQTLPQNIAANPGICAKFLVLDYNSKDHLDSWLKANCAAEIESGKLVVYRYSGAGRFRMAHAKNMAHRLGIIEGGDILVNLDADNFTGPGFADYVTDMFQAAREAANRDILLWARWNQPGMEPGSRIPKGCCGRIVVSAQSFLKAGGYDEIKFDAWGPDDKDFHFRLRRLGVVPQIIPPQYLGAILHTDKMRFKEYPEARIEAADYLAECFNDSDETIANWGKFGMGVVFRNFSRMPIELGEVATRVFGIGMHKTATTSLHRALTILGMDSGHWQSVDWARDIWHEMNNTGRSRTIEKCYAVSDLPIPLLYEKLDRSYPGSKFILTRRNEGKWLASVQKHWSRANSFRDTWNKVSAFPHKIHAILYGQPDFDAELFLARYRFHNAAVRAYFKNRPNDLLVMDMDEGKAGWLELCGFLKMPIPTTSYPGETF